MGVARKRLQANKANGDVKRKHLIVPSSTCSSSKLILPKNLDLEQVKDEQCRRHLEPFIVRVFETLHPTMLFQYNWHIGLIAEYLEAMYLGQIMKLIINIPPRTLKSICCSVALPSWVLGKNPAERIICSSYDSSLSMELSVYCRNIIESEDYKRTFPDTVIASDQNEKKKYQTTQYGHRACTSVGGSITGRGGRYKIMDDPIDPEGGYSRAEIEAANRYIDQTWSSRNDDPKNTRELLVMQRVHVEDPTGHILKTNDGSWTHLKVPQEAPKKTIVIFPITGKELVREKGSLIHESRFGHKENEDAKIRLGTYGYSAQQQQEPVPLGGGRIKMEWFPRYKTIPKGQIIEVIQSYDTAGKGKDVNALSARLTFAWDGRTAFLVNVWADHVSYPVLRNIAKDAWDHERADICLIEDKSSGQSLIQDLRDPDEGKPEMIIVAIEPVGDKIMRLDVGTKYIEAGRIALPEWAPWLHEFETDLQGFPDPMYWDRLDAFSQFITWKFGKAEAAAPLDFW